MAEIFKSNVILAVFQLVLVSNLAVHGQNIPFMRMFAGKSDGHCPAVVDCHPILTYRCFENDHCVNNLKCCESHSVNGSQPEKCCVLPVDQESTRVAAVASPSGYSDIKSASQASQSAMPASVSAYPSSAPLPYAATSVGDPIAKNISDNATNKAVTAPVPLIVTAAPPAGPQVTAAGATGVAP